MSYHNEEPEAATVEYACYDSLEDSVEDLDSCAPSAMGPRSALPTARVAAADETASMTIRRVKTDYTSNLKEMEKRTNALDRYKQFLQQTPVKEPSPTPADEEDDDLFNCTVSEPSCSRPRVSTHSRAGSPGFTYTHRPSIQETAPAVEEVAPAPQPATVVLKRRPSQLTATYEEPTKETLPEEEKQVIEEPSCEVPEEAAATAQDEEVQEEEVNPVEEEEPLQDEEEAEEEPLQEEEESQARPTSRLNAHRDDIVPDYNPVYAKVRHGSPLTTPRTTTTRLDDSVLDQSMTSVDCSQPQTKTIRTSGRVSRQSEKLSVTGGSKKSFWIRPSSALYEMTASTAAKCTSKVDETRVSSVHSRPPTRVNSPRNSGVSPRPSSTAIRRGSAVSEVSERPPIKKSTASARSSSSAAKPLKRKASVNNSSVFERLASSTTSATENRVNNTTAVNTFDTSSSPSVSKKRSSSKMTRQASTKSGVESSSNKLTRRPSTATGLTSNAVVSSRASSTTTSARPSTAVASTADRQSESFRKHCERVAARNAAKEAEKAHDPELKFQRQRSSQMSLKKKKTEEGKVIHKVRRSSSLGVKSETPKQPVVKTVTPQTPPARLSGTISKKLLFEIHDDAADEEEPCPLSAAPRASERPPLPSALVGTPIPVPRKSAPRDDQPNHHSPIKSVKREGDKEASPCREELQKQEEEDAKVTTAAAALAAARQAYNARKQARTSTGSAPRLSANTSGDLLTAVLQGVAQQTRRVIPCYYCAEMQNVGTYKVHLDVCEGRSHTLLRDRGVSEEQLQQALEKVKELPIPSLVSEEGERETFTYAAFLCAKTLLVKCSKCQTSVRVHDVKEHELLCGRSYYVGSKAEQRLREAVDRIQEGISDSNESSKKF